MAGYLDQYGVADAQREGRLKKIVLSGTCRGCDRHRRILYVSNLESGARRQEFPGDALAKRLPGGLSHVGLHARNPLQVLRTRKFNEDWGPKSSYANAENAKVENIDFCDAGVVFDLSFPGADPVAL